MYIFMSEINSSFHKIFGSVVGFSLFFIEKITEITNVSVYNDHQY